MCGVPPKVSDPKNSRQASPFLDFHFHVRFKKSFFWRLVAECPRGGCGCGLVMVEYITPRILPNGLIFEIYILNLKYSIPSFQHQFKLTQCLFLCGTRPNLIEDRLILIKNPRHLTDTPPAWIINSSMSFFWCLASGHGCGNGGIYHPPGSAPNGLPTWVKLRLILGGGEQAGLVRANRGQSTNIFLLLGEVYT